MTYGRVTPGVVEQLREIVGPRFVIHDDPEQMERYSRDEVTEKEYHHAPDAVVRPRTADEIARIMKMANKERIPVTPRGAGHGYVGGCVPVRGGMVLSLIRMNRIIEIDEADFVAVVEAGVQGDHRLRFLCGLRPIRRVRVS